MSLSRGVSLHISQHFIDSAEGVKRAAALAKRQLDRARCFEGGPGAVRSLLSKSAVANGSLKGVDDLVGAAGGKARSSGNIVVQGGRKRAKELFREFDSDGVRNRTLVRDKTGGGPGVEGALDDGTPLRIRMKPDGTSRTQAGDQKFISPPK